MLTYGEYFKRRSEGETVKSIAESIGSNPKALNRALNRVGYESEGIGNNQRWIWKGEGSEPLELEFLFDKRPTNKPINKPTNKPENKEINNPESKVKNNMERQESRNPESKGVATKKVTYEIEEWLHNEIKVKAIREKRNVSEIVNEILKNNLKK